MSTDDSPALALTAWGASTIDSLQQSDVASRDEVARRACEEAISDAGTLASLQGGLFEKLLVIERFGLYRAYLVRDGEVERGCESIQEFLERAVAPVVQLHRATIFKLREAVWEAGRLMERYGTLKADWTNLYLLAAETRRQAKGVAVLPAEDYEQLSQKVAEGTLTQRELSARLQRRPATARPRRASTSVRCLEATAVAPRRLSPFDELARLAADVRAEGGRPSAMFGKTLDQAEELLVELRRLALQTPGTWARPEDPGRLGRVMSELRDVAGALVDATRPAEA